MVSRPDGDVWNIVDNDKDSQHYGNNFRFDFSYISSEEIEGIILPDGTRFNCILYDGKTVQEVYDEIQKEKEEREDRSDDEER